MFGENVWLEVSLASSIVVSWLAMALALLCYSRLRKQATITQRLYEQLDHNLQLTNSGSVGMGKRLLELERKLVKADKKAQQTRHFEISQELKQGPELSSAPTPVAQPVHTSFDSELADAARLLNAGLPSEEVARRCGLSRAEASLMELMHNQVQGAQSMRRPAA